MPGRPVTDVVSQLIWRALGPYKRRSRSVIAWVGLGDQRPASFIEVARRHGITPPAVRHRALRVAAAGRRAPVIDTIGADLDRPIRPGEDAETRRRCARLLGLDNHKRPLRPKGTAWAAGVAPPRCQSDSSRARR